MKKRKNIILHEDDPQIEKWLRKILGDEGYQVVSHQQFMDATDIDPNIVIIDIDTVSIPHKEIARLYRTRYYQCPLQIVFIGTIRKRLLMALEHDGADDFIQIPVEDLDFCARIKASEIRLVNQYHLIQEREFFRNAVKQEEELSARILDQHVSLKEAFRNIERFNQELSSSNRRLEEIARRDVLSGLLNRMSLFHAIDVEIDRAMRTASSLSGIMIDIDHFKNINDNHGHLVGDSIIKNIGERLKSLLRSYDYAGRYGGEEFLVILPGTSLEQASAIAERFRSDLEKHPLPVEGIEFTVTASLGVSIYQEGESRDNWIKRLDMAMYEAKHHGRNKVAVL